MKVNRWGARFLTKPHGAKQRTQEDRIGFKYLRKMASPSWGKGMTQGVNGAPDPRSTTRDLRTKKSTAKRSRANVWFLKSDRTFAWERLGIDFLSQMTVRRSRVDDREKSRQNARHLPPVVIPLVPYTDVICNNWRLKLFREGKQRN